MYNVEVKWLDPLTTVRRTFETYQFFKKESSRLGYSDDSPMHRLIDRPAVRINHSNIPRAIRDLAAGTTHCQPPFQRTRAHHQIARIPQVVPPLGKEVPAEIWVRLSRDHIPRTRDVRSYITVHQSGFGLRSS
jgi:hypothetical protein